MGADPGSEPVEVVDESGTVVDVVTRRRMRAGNLRHRCTYVAVAVDDTDVDVGDRVDHDGDDWLSLGASLVVHQRAPWKDVFPSHWDVAFGGVCAVGEPWLASAERELAEEAGLAGVPLIELGLASYDDHGTSVLGMTYLAVVGSARAATIVPVDGEVVAIDRVPLGELGSWTTGRSVCPDSASIVLPLVLRAAGI